MSLGIVKEVLGRHNSLEKVKRIVARWLRAQICIDRRAIAEPVLDSLLRLAELLIFQVGAEETDQLLKTNKAKLSGLTPSWSNGVFGRPGGLVTKERPWRSKGGFRIHGGCKFPILLPETRLA